jgi:hypothetical protein
VCEILIHANRQERFFPTSARRRIAPEDQIFIIISPLFVDNPHTYIHPSGIKNIKDNLVFQRVEHKVYEISSFTIASTLVPIYPDYGTIIQNG